MSFGAILREKREEKNFSINDIERDIKIRAKYLIALETEDLDSLPGKVYALGFLKNYAKYLGLEEQELLEEIKQYYSKIEILTDVEPVEENISQRTGQKQILFIMIAIALSVIVLLALFLGKTPKSNETNPPTAQNSKAQKPQNNLNKSNENNTQNNTQPNTPTLPDLKNPQKSGVVLRSTGRAWVQVRVEGKEVYRGILENKEVKTFDGKEVFVKVGNAGAIDITYQGKHLGYLGKEGEVVSKIFNK